MSSQDALRDLDGRIHGALSHVGLVDRAIVDGEPVDGYYVEDFVEAGAGEEAVAGLRKAFDCRVEALPRALVQDEVIEIEGHGPHRYLRGERYGLGRVILVLGTLLPES